MELFYLVLSVVGLLAPLYFLAQFVAGQTPGSPGWLSLAIANPVALQLTADVLIAAIAFIGFAYSQCRTHQLRGFWWYVVATFVVGICFCLPFFLYFRERRLGGEMQQTAASVA